MFSINADEYYINTPSNMGAQMSFNPGYDNHRIQQMHPAPMNFQRDQSSLMLDSDRNSDDQQQRYQQQFRPHSHVQSMIEPPMSADKIHQPLTKKASVSPQIKIDQNKGRNEQLTLSFSAISSAGNPEQQEKVLPDMTNPIDNGRPNFNMATI